MRAALLVACVGLVLSGCASGSGAVAQGGTFDFVSPGGQTQIRYDPDDRGTIGNLTGPGLLDGTTISLDDYVGDVVVLNLWGQWCGPCRAESDQLEQVWQATRGSGVQFLGINVKDPERDKPQDYVRDNGITYPSIWDPTYRSLLALGGDYPTSVVPSTIVLDRKHRVAAVFLQELLVSDLQPVVERVAAEASS